MSAYSDNCTAPGELTLRLRRTGVSTGFPLLPGGPQLTLTPADLGSPVFVEVWARDQAGNTAYVFAGITVENPAGCLFALLPDTLRANVGLSNSLDDVTWLLDEKLPTGTILTSFVTDGKIVLPENLFAGPAHNNTAIITPHKDDNPLNGVSTYDIVLMTKAILELEPLANPYKYLAADVNRDNKVSALDAVEIRRLILGIYTELPDNRSWRFVPDDYIFPMPENPFYEEVPGSVRFDRHRQKPLPDFIPLKVGDVNGNAVTNSFKSPAETRTAARLRLPDQALTPGQRVLMPVTIPDVQALFGLQGALAFDPAQLRITGIVPAALSDFSSENYFQPEPGLLNFSWTDLEQLAPAAGDTLFFLEIEALRACRLSRALRLQTGRLEAEAYTAGGEIAALALEFAPLPLPAADKVGAAFPNPASGVLYVPVELAQPGRVSLELFDASGRRVYFFEENWPAEERLLETSVVGLPAGSYGYRASAGSAVERGVFIRN